VRALGGALAAAALAVYVALVVHLAVRPMSGVLRRDGRGRGEGAEAKECLADAPAICYGTGAVV